MMKQLNINMHRSQDDQKNTGASKLFSGISGIVICTVMLFVLSFSIMISPFSLSPSYAAHDSDGALDDSAHVDDLDELLREYWVTAHQMMTEQLVATMMQQVMIIGSFFDAKHQLETQRLIQDLNTQAHKDYHPGIGMCEIGTNVRSLAATDITRMEHVKIFNKILMDREVGKRGSASYFSVQRDYDSKIRSFRKNYCDQKENNEEVEFMCKGITAPAARMGRDVDFTYLMDEAQTLDIDFRDTDITADEEDVISLSRYLFANKTFEYVAPQLLNQNQARDVLMDLRSVHAMRSVPRNSFSHLVAMKAKGSEEATPFLRNILTELGVPDPELEFFVNQNPSYFSQMEILTQKLYQRPEFYTNLYDKPANVKRTGAALQAIKLMQDRDRYESALRREMLVSVMIETKLRKQQEIVERQIFGIIPNLNRGGQ